MPVDDIYTVALFHMEGADGSVDFVDESGKTWSVGGNAQIDTAQKKFGDSSGLFDGNTDYLKDTGHADFVFGLGDFTIDMWIRLNSIANPCIFYDGRPAGTTGKYQYFFVNNDRKMYYTVDAGAVITGTTLLSTGIWYHVALVRYGTSTKMYLNGNQEGLTYVDNNNYLVGANRPIIGASGFSEGQYSMNGWIDEVRVSKGIARWITDFTPPTSPYVPFPQQAVLI